MMAPRTAPEMASSSTTSGRPDRTVATVSPARRALAGSASQVPTFAAGAASRTLAPTSAGDRKFCCTNRPSARPMRSLLAGMMAVCGIGTPSGWRNRAVTANQSASAPTMAASAVARTGPIQVTESSSVRVTMNTTAAPTSNAVAKTFMRRSPARRSASSSGPGGGGGGESAAGSGKVRTPGTVDKHRGRSAGPGRD